MITSKFPVVGAGKRFWRNLVARPDRGAPRLRFWLMLLWQTLTGRHLLPLSREMREPYQVWGLHFVPQDGPFTLAVNHTTRRWLPRLMAVIHDATQEVRPELGSDWLVVVGYRQRDVSNLNSFKQAVVRQARRLHRWLFRRWQHNIVRLPMEGDQRVGLEALREWRKRAKIQPTFVFPEGRGRQMFEEIRPGAGRFLAGLGVPVLPVSAWWDEAAGCWQIAFGPPIQWSAQSRLHDLQIGLEIAQGLPPQEAPEWQARLSAWNAAYEPEEAVELPIASLPVISA